MMDLLSQLQEAKFKVAILETELLLALFKADKKDLLGNEHLSAHVSNIQMDIPDDYPQTGSWRSKYLFWLRAAGKNDAGLQRAELINLLRKNHIGDWHTPAVDAQLAHMAREGKVRIERNDGRNTYYIA